MEQIQLTQKQVRFIPPNPRMNSTGGIKPKKLRVAAYCRVSTDDDDQLNSYEAQVDYYTQKINNTDNWTMAGIFADEGITGTNMKKRDEFKRMLSLCRKGQIDMILTKSVSRFARNTVDCLDTVRELKARSIPVFFEKENINTMLQQSEFIITLYSGFAQAESESISQNVTWGKRKSMKDGNVIFQYSKLLGYEKGEDGKPRIVPEEAATVVRIYRSYLAGYSLDRIQQELTAEGIPTASGIKGWSKQVIQNILSNEKYIGDALLQKSFVTDCLTKRTKKNTGELPQYYVEDNHPAIVSRELYNRVQEETARRSNKRKIMHKSGKTEHGKFSGKYALSERLVCGECGSPYRRCTWARNGVKRIVWRCISRLEYGTKYCKESPTIDEHRLHAAILHSINEVVTHRDEIVATLKHSLKVAINGNDDEITDAFTIQRRLDQLDVILSDLIELSAKSGASGDYFDARFKEVTDEQKALKKQLREMEQQKVVLANADARLNDVFEIIESLPLQMGEYDDALTALIIERVTVVSTENIKVQFLNGIVIEASLGE